MLQNKESIEPSEEKDNDIKQENNDNINEDNIQIDCDIHAVFNGYINGAQLIDVREKKDYEKSHIHCAYHVDINNPEKSMIKLSKKIICYDYTTDNINTKKYNKLYNYCKTAKACQSFRITNSNFDYNQFRTNYAFMCFSVEQEKKIDSERKKYPNYIIDGLYLGDMWNRQSSEELKELGVTHIVDATQDNFNTLDFKILKISLSDTPSSPIDKWFNQTVEFVSDALKNKNNAVFIHCQMGISRSTTLVLAYLMKAKNYTLYNGYKLCQTNRPRIRPNDGFFQKLLQYELKIHGKSTKQQIDKDDLRNFNNQECIVM